MINMMQGDCMELMARTPDRFYELAIVDPPYGIGINMNQGRRSGNEIKHERKKWDSCAPDSFYWEELTRVSESQIVFGANNFNWIPPTENLYQPTENMEVARIDRLESMVEILVKAMASIPAQIIQIANNQPKQIEFKQDYYTIKGYASKNKMQLTFSEALKLGRECGNLSLERGAEIRKADDEQFGQVNSYHIDILKEVFSL